MAFSGQKLKTIRGNMSADEFIKAVGLNLKTRYTLYHWEDGTSEPKATQLYKIAEYCNVKIEYFFVNKLVLPEQDYTQPVETAVYIDEGKMGRENKETTE